VRTTNLMLICCILVLSGCQQASKVEVPIPGDGTQIITGQAAVDYVKGLKPTSAKLNETVPTLVFILVGGLVFWGLTRSKWGWIIPGAAISGIAVIMMFTQFSKWISFGVLVITLGVLAYKAIEYKRERDAQSL